MALNEDEPEPVEDLLEPDYEEMQIFQPVINKFKAAFFDGHDSDTDAMAKPRAARGTGRGTHGGKIAGSSQESSGVNGLGPVRKPVASKKRQAVEPINEACLGDSDDDGMVDNTKKQVASQKRRRMEPLMESQAKNNNQESQASEASKRGTRSQKAAAGVKEN